MSLSLLKTGLSKQLEQINPFVLRKAMENKPNRILKPFSKRSAAYDPSPVTFYFTSQGVAKVMKKQGGGKIINIASIDGIKPELGVSIYNISKAGIRMITRAFAVELAPCNIRVNTIALGPISTKLLDSYWVHLTPEEFKKQKDELTKMTPMGRIGELDEIVGAVICLASYATSYTTRAEIEIDGGPCEG